MSICCRSITTIGIFLKEWILKTCQNNKSHPYLCAMLEEQVNHLDIMFLVWRQILPNGRLDWRTIVADDHQIGVRALLQQELEDRQAVGDPFAAGHVQGRADDGGAGVHVGSWWKKGVVTLTPLHELTIYGRFFYGRLYDRCVLTFLRSLYIIISTIVVY